MEKLVSVIVPVYNMADFVEPCVNCLLKQSYTSLEIVIVNDGSSDDTAKICESLAQKHPQISLINQENQGVSMARNNGMKAAKGDYFIFLDADDTMPEGAVKALVEAAEANGADMTMGKISPNEELPIGSFSGDEFLVKCLEDNPVAYYSVRTLYKRSFVEDLCFKKGFICGEDSFFVFECALKKPTVVTVDEWVYSYYIHQNSATHTAFNRKRYDSICGLLDLKEQIVERDFPHLLPIFYHLKTKIQMMLLATLAASKGKALKAEEKETLSRFNSCKKYYRADLPCSNPALFNALNKYGYPAYKALQKLKSLAKRALGR